MEIQVLARLKPTKYPERAKDVHSNNGIAWSGWVLGVLAVFFTASTVTAQPNLVPNPSFENYDDCPFVGGRVWYAPPWVNVRNSCDYFHACGTNGFGVPLNAAGSQQGRTGQAYIGLGTENETSADSLLREFVGVSLITPLMPSTNYRVLFHVSMGDSVWYSGKNIGAYFSVGQPSDDFQTLLTKIPQVSYSGDFLTNKDGWTRIEGTFTAQGGENFLTIGNFDPDSLTETVFVEGGGVPKPWAPDYWKSVYYFIDDVSVIDVDSLVGIEGPSIGEMNIYPNPAQEYLIVETEQRHSGTVRLLDMAGRQVAVPIYSQNTEKWHVDIANIPPGIYLLEVHNKDGRKAVQKVVVQH